MHVKYDHFEVTLNESEMWQILWAIQHELSSVRSYCKDVSAYETNTKGYRPLFESFARAIGRSDMVEAFNIDTNNYYNGVSK